MVTHPHIGREITRAGQRAQRLRAALKTTRHRCGRAFAVAARAVAALALLVSLAGGGGPHVITGTAGHLSTATAGPVGTATAGPVGTGTGSRGNGKRNGGAATEQQTPAGGQQRKHKPGPHLPEEPGTWDTLAAGPEGLGKRRRDAHDDADSAPPESL
jgi:hypothetical protein